ncbi:hypothetical protein [Sporosarcina globispora]|nr:hypothetical protein [Sporosarcina globispora]
MSNNEEKKKGSYDKNKTYDDGCAPGCVDLFILPIQVLIAGYQIINLF